MNDDRVSEDSYRQINRPGEVTVHVVTATEKNKKKHDLTGGGTKAIIAFKGGYKSVL